MDIDACFNESVMGGLDWYDKHCNFWEVCYILSQIWGEGGSCDEFCLVH